MSKCKICGVSPWPTGGRGVEVDTDEPERRPIRRGEASEARRLEYGFSLLEGEGVYADEGDEA